MNRCTAEQPRRLRRGGDPEPEAFIERASTPILDIHVEGEPVRPARPGLLESRGEQGGADASPSSLALHSDRLEIPISGVVPIHGDKERPGGKSHSSCSQRSPAGSTHEDPIGSPASVPGMPLRRPTTRPSSSARVACSSDNAWPGIAQAAARIDSAAAPKSSVNNPSEAASSPRAQAFSSRSISSAGRRRLAISRGYERADGGCHHPRGPARSLVTATSTTSAIPAAATPLT